MDSDKEEPKRVAVDPEVMDAEDESRRRRADQAWSASYFSYNPYLYSAGGGCLSPAITLALFLICLGKFGVLAAIGFAVFFALGTVIRNVHDTKRLMRGLPVNPWISRCVNWVVCFFLVFLLAGGAK